MKLVKKAKRGFTLVELVVVIAVIAILAAVSVGAYFGVTESANNSRLEQETKQIHTAIQTVGLKGNSNHTLSSDGLTVTNIQAFELALEEATGTEMKVVTEDDFVVTVPTIHLTETYTKPQNGPILYKGYEYFNPEISGKKVVVEASTGNFDITTTDIEVNTTANMKTFYFIDRGWWHENNQVTKLYAFGDGENKNNAWPGLDATYVETIQYEDETLNVYSYDVDLNKYHTIIWSTFNGETKASQTTDIELATLGDNNLCINVSDESTTQFTPSYGVYIPGKADYGQFPEANNVTYYFLDQEWWHENNHETKIYFFNKTTGNNPAWITSFKDTTLVETIATEGHGSVNVYSITLDLNKWDTFIAVRTTAEGTVKSQTEDIAISTFEDGENLAVLLDQEEVIKTDNNSAKCLVTTDTYVAGKWDYGQYPVIQEDIRTIYLKTAAWFDEAGAYPYICTYTGSTESDQLPMTLILDDVLGGISYWSAEVDLATHDGVYFKRMGTEGEQTNYWGATSVNFTRVQLEENNFATIANEAKWTDNNNAKFDISLSTYSEDPTYGDYTLHLKGYKSWDSIDGNKINHIADGYTISGVELTETTTFKVYNDDVDLWMGSTYFELPENFIDDGTNDHNIKTTVAGVYTISISETGLFTAEKTGEITTQEPDDNEGDEWVIQDGYYLVGSMNNWGEAINSQEIETYMFTRQDNYEMSLSVNLKSGWSFKVVKVVGGSITDWYGGNAKSGGSSKIDNKENNGSNLTANSDVTLTIYFVYNKKSDDQPVGRMWFGE